MSTHRCAKRACLIRWIHNLLNEVRIETFNLKGLQRAKKKTAKRFKNFFLCSSTTALHPRIRKFFSERCKMLSFNPPKDSRKHKFETKIQQKIQNV